MIYSHAAVALAAAIAASAAAWKVQAWRFDSERLEAAEYVREIEKMRRQAANKGAVAHEADKIVIRKVFVPIREEIERVVKVYGDRSCLDLGEVQLLNKAITDGNTDSPVGDSPKAPSQ